MSGRVAIIGGGLGGLAAAITLAGRGYPVTLFEKKPTLEENFLLDKDGFHFDLGSTLLTMPRVLDRIFREANRKLYDYVKLKPLDPQYRCFLSDGTAIDLLANVDQMISTFGRGYWPFLQKCNRMAYLADRYLFWRSVGGWRDLVNWRFPADVLSLLSNRSIFETARSYVSERAAYVIAAPWQAAGPSPAWKLCLPHFQITDGVWQPAGGISSIANALIQLIHELGIEFRLARAIGSDELMQYRGVISNDTEASQSEFVEVIFHLGLSHGYPHLSQHNYLISESNMTYHVHASSLTTLSVSMCVARKLTNSVAALRSSTLANVASIGQLIDIESRIQSEAMRIHDVAMPRRFYASNRSGTHPNHYYAGPTVHPGPGIAMELMSGWIAADALDQDAFQAGTKPNCAISDVPY